MKTRPSKPTGSSFPTCGEVFQFLVNSLDLLTWQDAFIPGGNKDTETQKKIKKVAEKLSIWAKEQDAIPSRADFTSILTTCLEELPSSVSLGQTLLTIWNDVLEMHTQIVRGHATYFDAKQTREWYVKAIFPKAMTTLWRLLIQTRHIQPDCRLLKLPIHEIIGLLNTDKKKPLTAWCHHSYSVSDALEKEGHIVDRRTITDWEAGKPYPQFLSLQLYYSGIGNIEPLVIDFAFARLIERLFEKLCSGFGSDCTRQELHSFALKQARILWGTGTTQGLDLQESPPLSNIDHSQLVGECIQHFEGAIAANLKDPNMLQGRPNPFHWYGHYNIRYIAAQAPEKFEQYVQKFMPLEAGTRLEGLKLIEQRTAFIHQLDELHEQFPEYSHIFSGPLSAIEARLALTDVELTIEDRLQNASKLYKRAVEESVYSAGVYTKRIVKEALGLWAFIDRWKVIKGSYGPFNTRMLAWWDLLDLGSDFDQDDEELRIEKAENAFIDMVSEVFREQLRAGLPQVVIPTRLMGGLITIQDPNHPDLMNKQVSKTQRRRSNDSTIGRSGSAMMTAIEKGQLERARDLLKKGTDLNACNTANDTAITKAFAQKDFDLIMLMLKREENPVSLATLQRVTQKKQNSPLDRAIALGRPDILMALASYGPGNRSPLDMDTKSCRGYTPLYYAIGCLREVIAGIFPLLDSFDPKGSAEDIASGIRCLIHDIGVELDTTNVNDHTALTLCAEIGQTDLAIELLNKGAFVNHRCLGGGTALCFAIQNNDRRLVSALREYKADYTLFVEGLGRPIYTMPMSEELRQFIPHRLP